MILNQETFCRHYCENDYDEIVREQTKECEDMVACSCSENGINPDAACAKGLMMKCEEELFEEALYNFSRIIHFAFNEYNTQKKPASKLTFSTWWKKEGTKFLDVIKKQK